MGYIGQAEDEWEAKQRKLKAKAERASKEACPVCGKRCTNVHQHAKDVHNAKLVEVRVRQPKYIAIGGDAMTNENPYKVGDKVEVTSSTAYSQVWDCAGTVCSVFSPLLTAYCVWVKFDSDELGYEWPFALDEVVPHSPAEGSV